MGVKLLAYIEGETEAEGVREQDAEEGNWT